MTSGRLIAIRLITDDINNNLLTILEV